MPTGSQSTDNRSRVLGDAYRREVGSYLTSSGLSVSVRNPWAKAGFNLSETINDAMDQPGDIRGLRDWVLMVSRVYDMTKTLPTRLAQARRDAQLAGHKIGAVVQWRRELPIADSYVVLALEDWVELTKRLEKS
jgi:hypothetical protein